MLSPAELVFFARSAGGGAPVAKVSAERFRVRTVETGGGQTSWVELACIARRRIARIAPVAHNR